MLSNRTLTDGPVQYTKGAAPFTVMINVLFFDFFQSWIKDRSISTNGLSSFTKNSKIKKILLNIKKIEKKNCKIDS